MSKKRKVLMISILVLIVVLFMFYSENDLTKEKLAKEFKENQVVGVKKLIESAEVVEYFYSRGINDYNAGRITTTLTVEEKNEFQDMLSNIDIASFRNVDVETFYSIGDDLKSGLYIGDYYHYKLAHDNINYSIELKFTEDNTGIMVMYWPSGITDISELITFSEYEPLAILIGPAFNNLKEIYQFRSLFLNNVDDQSNCANVEILDDYENGFPAVGEKYVLNKAISSEIQHYFEGIIYLVEPLKNKENISFDVEVSIGNNVYYLNSIERVLMHDDEMYLIDSKYRWLVPRLTRNSEITIK